MFAIFYHGIRNASDNRVRPPADNIQRVNHLPEFSMQDTQLNRISNFLWSVSDDLLRDLYVRGKYRDVILPMTVLRRLDAVLEPTKQKVLKEKQFLDDNGITEQDGVLQQEAGHAFYNTSQFTMRDLAARAAQQSLRADFEAYLDGYSANVQEILDCFEFRNQINRLSRSDATRDPDHQVPVS